FEPESEIEPEPETVPEPEPEIKPEPEAEPVAESTIVVDPDSPLVPPEQLNALIAKYANTAPAQASPAEEPPVGPNDEDDEPLLWQIAPNRPSE
ncbi:MAG: hypothetical protein ACI8W8_003594, partial [Rhodothermales bacterium]